MALTLHFNPLLCLFLQLLVLKQRISFNSIQREAGSHINIIDSLSFDHTWRNL